MTLNISKGDSLVSFKVISLEEGPHDANTWINFLIKGISEEFEIGEAQSHTVQLQQIDQETEVVINFSETFVHISENEPNPFEIRMDITGSINHSDRVIIRIQAPDNITYGSRYRTLPGAVLQEINLDVIPGSTQISFLIEPINDYAILGNYDIHFTLIGSEQIKAGEFSQLQVRIEEDDNIPVAIHSIADLKALFEYHTGLFWIPDDYFIEGVITSGSNVSNLKHAYIQDSTGGILLRFVVAHQFAAGDQVRLNLKGATGQRINEQKAIFDLTDLTGILVKSGVIVQPKTITLDQLHSGEFSGLKVRINDVFFPDSAPGMTFLGNRRIQGVDKTAIIMTTEHASFANVALPTRSFSIIGIVGDWGYLMPQDLASDIIF